MKNQKTLSMENFNLEENNILFTGGSGLLGSEMKKLFPSSAFPTHNEFDITNADSTWNDKIKLIVHCAVIKSPPKIEKDPISALETNIVGTANLVRLCQRFGIKLIYISSDYVFQGTKGNYNEESELYPITKYGWSKLGGECAVRMYENSLIVRMTFFPNIFPYLKGFVDQRVSRIPVTNAAEILKDIIYSNLKGVIHLGGLNKTTYDFAVSTSGGNMIEKISINSIDCPVPKDVTMNISKLEEFLGYKITI